MSRFTHFFCNFFVTEKQTPQTFTFLECMLSSLWLPTHLHHHLHHHCHFFHNYFSHHHHLDCTYFMVWKKVPKEEESVCKMLLSSEWSTRHWRQCCLFSSEIEGNAKAFISSGEGKVGEGVCAIIKATPAAPLHAAHHLHVAKKQQQQL